MVSRKRVAFPGLWGELPNRPMRKHAWQFLERSYLISTSNQPVQWHGIKPVRSTHRLHSSPFMGLPYRVLNMSPKKEYYGASR